MSHNILCLLKDNSQTFLTQLWAVAANHDAIPVFTTNGLDGGTATVPKGPHVGTQFCRKGHRTAEMLLEVHQSKTEFNMNLHVQVEIKKAVCV